MLCPRNCPAKFFKKECGIQRVTSDLTWCESLSQRHFEYLCYLLDNNIKFKMEYWFQDLKLEKPLRFDFAIFNNDDKLIELVEIQGDQHYNPGFLSQNGFEKFQKQQIRDSLKNKYCEDNKIPLLRIPYWEKDNIDTIIESISSTTMNNTKLFLECKRLTFEMGSISNQEDVEMKI